jgi:apolipoprotein N-acyltransferase
VASVTGACGVDFLMTWLATVVNRVWEGGADWRRARTTVGVYAGVLVAVLAGGAVRLTFFAPHGARVLIAGISPGRTAETTRTQLLDGLRGARAIALAAPARVRPALAVVNDNLLATTEREATAGARIVVWPENGAMVRAADEPALLASAASIARQHHIYVDLGLLVLTQTAPYAQDETQLVGPDGTLLWTYQKMHPIIGSEPYRPGTGPVPVVGTPYGQLSNVICYDADFPSLMRVSADIMLVPAHDLWQYGVGHTDRAEVRAIENGYALVRQDDGGFAATFDDQGRVLASSNYVTTAQQTMLASVPTRGTHTVYDAIGDTFAWLCVGGVGLGILWSVFGRRRTG